MVPNVGKFCPIFPDRERRKIRRKQNNKDKQSHTTPDLSGSLKLRYVHWRRQSQRKLTIKRWVQGNNRARKLLKPKAPIHPILTLTQKENNNKKEKPLFLWSSHLFLSLSMPLPHNPWLHTSPFIVVEDHTFSFSSLERNQPRKEKNPNLKSN